MRLEHHVAISVSIKRERLCLPELILGLLFLQAVSDDVARILVAFESVFGDHLRERNCEPLGALSPDHLDRIVLP